MNKKAGKFENKKYRSAYVNAFVGDWLAFQIMALRRQRSWTRAHLAKLLGTTQSVASRLENANCGPPGIKTILKLASAFDVAVQVRFIPFSEFLADIEDVSEAKMRAKSFEDELQPARKER